MPTKKPPGLSKSRLLRGLQCPKSLYLTIHRPELETPADPSQKAVFEQGHRVGLEAHKHFPGGVLIEVSHRDQQKALKLTAEALANGAHTIYEATFEHEGVLAKVDILNRASARAGWDLIEVKSSTKVKAVHIDDVAIQKMVVTGGSGVKVKDAVLMHINSKCVAPDLSKLFTKKIITEEVNPILAALPEKLKALREMLSKPKPPAIAIGPHCSSPYDCPFKKHCWSEAKVPTPSVFDFPSIGPKAWKYFEKGILRLEDPRFGPFNGTNLKRIEAIRTGKRWVDTKKIRAEISGWVYPLHFLDFETVGPAIPVHPGTRPYLQIPFQFSVLVQKKLGGEFEESAYLHDDASDPRLAVAQALVKATGARGSIVAYNKTFEATCLKMLAELFPDYSEKLLSFASRLVDPLPVIRAAVYDAGFKGSFSIKDVAPAILGAESSYDALVVAGGQAAQIAFAEMVSAGTSAARKAELRAGLLAYCGQDTLVLGQLVGWMIGVTQRSS